MDERRVQLKAVLARLSREQLERIARTGVDGMVYDGCNFDAESGKFCPLAVGLGITNAKDDLDCSSQIAALGFNPRNMHGVPGTFYRTPHRGTDLLEVVNELLSET